MRAYIPPVATPLMSCWISVWKSSNGWALRALLAELDLSQEDPGVVSCVVDRNDLARRISVLVESERADDRVELLRRANLIEYLRSGRHRTAIGFHRRRRRLDNHHRGNVPGRRIRSHRLVERRLIVLEELLRRRKFCRVDARHRGVDIIRHAARDLEKFFVANAVC